MRRLFLAMIRFYQKHISPHFPPVCRYRPSCSAYAYQAIERFGAVRGVWLGMLRILRCNPFSAGGWDPVPIRFDLLGRHQIPQPDPMCSAAGRAGALYRLRLAPREKYYGFRTSDRQERTS